jgi:hypothetical protein
MLRCLTIYWRGKVLHTPIFPRWTDHPSTFASRSTALVATRASLTHGARDRKRRGRVRGCSPGERLGVLIVLVKVAVDGGLEVDYRPEDAALEPPSRQDREDLQHVSCDQGRAQRVAARQLQK